MQIVLASASPRRRELMQRIAPHFRIHPVDVDESSVRDADPVRFAIAAAVLKAKKAGESIPSAVIIGADTVVALGPHILGKPENRESARGMLASLSGRRHRVITGVALYRHEESRVLTGYELTRVTFRELSPEMIEAYLDAEDYLDKAGAYAVQDIGDEFVSRLEGDYDNVVGLPVKRVKRLLSFFERPPLVVTIEDSAFPEDCGIARPEGKRVLIKGTVIGDRARIQVTREGGGTSTGELLDMIESSPFRVSPRCRHFGTCGGCRFQDWAYSKQLELKARFLRRILDEAAIPGFGAETILPVVPSPEVYVYRNKMEFCFGEAGGRTVLGLRERNSGPGRAYGHTVAIDRCPISSPLVESLFPLILDFVRDKDLAPHRAATGEGLLRHLVLRQAKRTGELLLILVTSGAVEEDLHCLAGRIAEEIPQLTGFFHAVNARISDVVVFEPARLLWGRPFIKEEIEGLSFRIHPETFFQTNTAAAEGLYRRIRELGLISPEKRVLGLYCGTGPLEILLAGRAMAVTGIDSLAENIRIAEENRAANSVSNISFVTGTVEKFLKEPPPEPWDVLLVDPPRAGISAKGLRRMVALGIPEMVYVSCNPKTLARDLRALAASGYRIRSLEPFDFFPHTPHIETLTILGKDR